MIDHLTLGMLVRLVDARPVYRVSCAENVEPYERDDNIGLASIGRIKANQDHWERVHAVVLPPAVIALIEKRLKELDREIGYERYDEYEDFEMRQERSALEQTLQWSRGEKVTYSE